MSGGEPEQVLAVVASGIQELLVLKALDSGCIGTDRLGKRGLQLKFYYSPHHKFYKLLLSLRDIPNDFLLV